MLYYTPVHTTFSFPSPSRPLTSIAETFRSEFRLSRHMVCVRRTKLQRGSFQIYRAETNTAVCTCEDPGPWPCVVVLWLRKKKLRAASAANAPAAPPRSPNNRAPPPDIKRRSAGSQCSHRCHRLEPVVVVPKHQFCVSIPRSRQSAAMSCWPCSSFGLRPWPPLFFITSSSLRWRSSVCMIGR